MSLSNNTDIPNPTSRWFEWGGKTGKIRYWDKEKEERVEIDLPFSFILLDNLSTITGFSDADNTGYWSNEVRSIQREKFRVRLKGKPGVVEEGFHSSKEPLSVMSRGAKFTQSLYVGYYEGDQMQIGCIRFFGAANSAWIDFKNLVKGQAYGTIITISGADKKKKGSNEYLVPIFEVKPCPKPNLEKAKKLDMTLQKYLKSYFARQAGEVDAPGYEDRPTEEDTDVDPATAEAASTDEPTNELPF